MFRTLNAEIFNSVANNPGIRPYLGGQDELDLTNIIENANNYCFLTDDKTGAHILINKGQGTYEVHTLSLPNARGSHMRKLMQEARAFMFLQTDCIELQTFVPDGQANVLLWAQYAGFSEDFFRDKCFNYKGDMIGGTYLSLSYNDWVLKDKDNLKVGQEFHKVIEPFELLTHPDDAVHDAWAGATCRSYNLPKAISYYNKWAARTGYAQLAIVSIAPFVIDFGNAILQLNVDRSLSLLKVNNKCLLEPHLVLLG